MLLTVFTQGICIAKEGFLWVSFSVLVLDVIQPAVRSVLVALS